MRKEKLYINLSSSSHHWQPTLEKKKGKNWKWEKGAFIEFKKEVWCIVAGKLGRKKWIKGIRCSDLIQDCFIYLQHSSQEENKEERKERKCVDFKRGNKSDRSLNQQKEIKTITQ